MFLAHGFEELEAVAVLDIIRRAEIPVVTVGVGGLEVTGSHQITLQADTTAAELEAAMDSDISALQIEGIVLPGGMPGTLNLSKSPAVNKMLDYTFENKLLIAAICAAPSVPGNRGMLKGVKACCFTGFEDMLQGARVHKTNLCVDKNFITASGAGAAVEFGLAIAAYIAGEKKSCLIRAAINPNQPIRNIKTEKEALRGKCKEYRAGLSAEERSRLDKAILNNTRELWQYKRAKILLTYVSLETEIDTHTLIKTALSNGKTVAVPRCIPGTRDMEFYCIRSLSDLRPGAFGVYEPAPDKQQKLKQFDESFCVLPGFCFDRAGYRIGYGKGYYDRFLSEYKGFTAGFCYSQLVFPGLPHGRFDVPANCVITEHSARFTGKSL